MFEKLRALFAGGVTAPGTTKKMPAGDVAWSESVLYSQKGWEKYNPDSLMGRKGYDIYQRMMQDEQVKAVVRFKRDAIASRPWYFKTEAKNQPPPPDEQPDTGQGQSTPDKPGELPQGKPPGIDAAGTDGAATMRRRFDAQPPPDAPDPNAAKPADTQPPPNAPSPEELQQAAQDKALAQDEYDAACEELEQRERVMEEIFARMRGTFTDGLHAILSALHNGFSMTEKVFEQFEHEGQTYIGLKALKARPFESFYFEVDQYGNISTVVQRWQGQQQDIDYSRFVHYVQNPDVDPHYGESELRSAYRAYWSKDVVTKLWNIYLERHASGFIWATSTENGPTLTKGTPEFTALQSALDNLTGRTSMIVPRGVEIHYETPSQTDSFEKAIASHDKAIAKALLVPNLLGISEQGNTGSYAQSQTQLEAFLWTLEAEAKRLEEAINEQIVNHLGDLNWGDGRYPRFCFKPISEQLRQNVLRMWTELMKAGAVRSTETDEAYVRELLDFPEAGEEIKTPPTFLPMFPGMMPGGPPGAPPAAQSGAPPDTAKPADQTPAELPDETVLAKRQLMARDRASKRVDYSVIDNKSTKIAVLGIERVHQSIRDGLQLMVDWIKEQNIQTNPDAAAEITMPARAVTKIRRAFEASLREGWDLGTAHGQTEISKAMGKRFIANSINDEIAKAYLESQSYRLAGDTADNVRKKVQTVVYNGIKGDWPIDEMVARIEEEVSAYAEPWAATSVRTGVFDAINEGRYSAFTDPAIGGFVEALEYSAVLDSSTTPFCDYMGSTGGDGGGRTYKVNNPIWDTHTPPNHYNCRSILIAITQRDMWVEDDPPTMDPASGFGG